MVYLYWTFIFCFVAPLLAGQLSRTLEQQHLVPDFTTRFPARVKALGEKALLAQGIIFFLALMLIVSGHKVSGGDTPFWVMIIAPFAIYLCTARLFYLRFKMSIHKYSASQPTKLLLAVLVFLAVWISHVYTDYLFLTYTRIPPSELPVAKTGVLVIVTSFVWVTLIALLTLIPYLLMAAAVGLMELRPSAKAEMCLSPANRASVPRWHNFTTFSLFIGLAVCCLSPLHLLDYTSKNPAFEPFVRQVIVFASFRLKDSQCAGNQPAGSVFAPLGYERLAIAIPDEEQGYLFKTIKCPDGNAAEAPKKKPKVTVPLERDQQQI